MQAGPRFSFWAFNTGTGVAPVVAPMTKETGHVASRVRAPVEKFPPMPAEFVRSGESPLLVCPEWAKAMGIGGAV